MLHRDLPRITRLLDNFDAVNNPPAANNPSPTKRFQFDATDDRLHGQQEGRLFHGYYDHHCYLPLYVFCGDELLMAYLRPSNIDAAKR